MKIILRADDLGLSEAVNYGIGKSITDGKITCVGMMPNMKSAKHGYGIVKDLNICLGQHTNISLGKPVSNPTLIPSLVNTNGEFCSSKEINKRKLDSIVLEECEMEIEAQINKFIDITGKKPSYIDGHAVFSPTYFKAIQNVARKYDVFYINPMDPDWKKNYGIKSMNFVQLDSNGLYDPIKYFEEQSLESDTAEYVLSIFHPGYIDQFLLENSSYTLIRPMECEFLCSDWLSDWIKKHGIEVISFNDYLTIEALAE